MAGGAESGPVQDAVTSALSGLGIGSSTFTHVMYIMPPGVSLGGAAAFAYVNWYLSVYADTYARSLLVLMHEIGYALNLSLSCFYACAPSSSISTILFSFTRITAIICR